MALLFQYLLNEAASGTAITTVNDTGPHAQHLTVDYDTNQLTWGSGVAGNHLNFAAIETNAKVIGNVNSALATALSGKTTFSVIVKSNYANGGASYPFTPYILIANEDSSVWKFRVSFAGLSGNPVDASINGVDVPVGYVSNGFFIISFDTTQANIADRYKVYSYNGGDVIDVTPTLVDGDLPQNTAFPTIVTTDKLVLGNADSLNLSGQGTLNYIAAHDVAFTLSQADTILNNLAANDDTNPFSTPTLSWVFEPAIDQITSSGGRLQLTTSLAATVKVLQTSAGSSQPSSGAFDAISSIGTTSAYTVFQYNITGQDPETTFRYWVQITDGTTTLYDYADLTTLAISDTILSVNGGQPIREGQTAVVVIREAGATGTTETVWNGVTQANHTVISDTESRFDVVWPNLRYGFTGTIAIGGQSITSPALVPPTGSAYVTLGSGYSASTPGAITAFPDAVPGDQIGYQTQSGAVTIDDLGRPTFTSAFNGNLVCWIIDSADGTRSANATIPYVPPADNIPDQFDLGANATNQEPGTYVVRSFTVLGVDSGVNVTFTATGSAQVSNDNSTWGSSTTQQLNGTVYVRIQTPALNQPSVAGGVSSSGVSDSFSVGVRAPSVPTITSQPTSQSVTSGAIATFTITATNAVSYQWRRNGVNISGANSTTYSRVTNDSDIGTSSISCVVTSSEGGTVTSNTVNLVVIAAATRITIPTGVVTARGVPLAGTTITANIYSVVSGKCGGLVYSTPITLSESGPTYIDNNQNGSIGTQRFLGIPSTIDNSEALFLVTVT